MLHCKLGVWEKPRFTCTGTSLCNYNITTSVLNIRIKHLGDLCYEDALLGFIVTLKNNLPSEVPSKKSSTLFCLVSPDYCPDFAPLNKGRIEYSTEGEHRVARAFCNNGTVMEMGSSIIRCINRQWDGITPICRGMDLEVIVLIRNQQVMNQSIKKF